jgi:GntR family transcriptional repressor for pyruvate dehydrogenase complex
MTSSILLTSQLVDWDHTLSFHQPIYQAIRRRDAEEARRRMRAHLMDAKNLLVRVRCEAQQLGLDDGIRLISRNVRQKAAKRK